MLPHRYISSAYLGFDSGTGQRHRSGNLEILFGDFLVRHLLEAFPVFLALTVRVLGLAVGHRGGSRVHDIRSGGPLVAGGGSFLTAYCTTYTITVYKSQKK